eukprot:TRINITY_DN5417_c0_g1_i2.p1 TRINITY_DN5417_c0_g1~~TRINITY_DN5417_c0_g1_i2.p1  ORF type:complete len:164 (+),score=1.80 TRINITY_DN5417_c0_g1_i2:66-494(+)
MMETKNSFLDAAEAFFLSEKPDDELAAVRGYSLHLWLVVTHSCRIHPVRFSLSRRVTARASNLLRPGDHRLQPRRLVSGEFYSQLTNCSIIEVGGVEVIDGVRTGAIFQSYALPTAPVNPMAFEVPGRHSVAFLTKSAGAQT